MCTPRRSIRKAIFAVLGLALFAVAVPSFADEDPPDRVARLSFIRGDVSFQPSGGDEWVQANLNRPLGTGDKLYTDRDSRVEMEVGAATLRLDAQSSFDILNLDDNIAQTQLTEGVMNLHVRRVFEGQSYEVDTPTLAFVVTQPGDYRVDIAPDGGSSMVTVFRGAGDVYGENNASYSVREGQSYRFHDAALTDYEVLDLPRPDDFDRWVDSRNNRYEHAVSRQYVSEEVIGYADLDDYGGWSDVPEYGHVWYPTTVAVGWAPYRDGHWSWIDPWGWTWVDDAAWGFAPFHYGRWVYAGNRWGWCPGPVHVRPIYAPALVAFVGGAGWGIGVSTGPVGWFPLGPRDVYVPWYRTSRNYFTNVNVRNTTIVNNTYITNVYNDYSRGRPITNVNYAYRQNAAAVTAVSRDAFVGARPVNAARVRVNENQLRNANVVSRVGIAPQRTSFVGANAARARVVPNAQALDRRVIARTAPPPRPAPVTARINAIERNGGQPLARQQLRQIAARPAATGTAAQPGRVAQRVQVVGQNAPKPKPLPARGPGAVGRQPGTPPVPARGPVTSPTATPKPNERTQPAERNVPSRGQPPERGAAQTHQQPTGNGLPSSRFAPHGGQPRAAGEATPRSTTAPSGNARETTGRPPNRATGRTPSESPAGTSERRSTTTRTSPPETGMPRGRTPPSTTPSEPRRMTTSPEPRGTPRSQTRTVEPRQQREPAPRTQPSYEPRSVPQTHNPPPQVQRSAPVQQQRAPQQQERRAPPPRERSNDRKKDDKDDNGGHR